MVAGDNTFSISRLKEVVNDSQGEGMSVKGEGDWPGALLARATRTIRMCSFDARNRGSTRLPLREIPNWSRESQGEEAVSSSGGRVGGVRVRDRMDHG